MNVRVHPAVLFAAIVVLALTGCGGGDSTTTGTVARPDRNHEANETIARAALVRPSDLPAGWTSRPDDANDFRCPAVEAAEAHPYAKSDRFDAPGGAGAAQHEVILLADEDAADAALDALVAQATLDCFARQGEASVRRQAAAGTDVGHVTAARLMNVSPSGDRAAGARLTYPVSANGTDATIRQDLLFTRVGRGLSLFAIVAQGVEPDEALNTALARRGAQRVRDALGGA